MKKVIWHPKARDEISQFPKSIRDELGYLIFRLQKGDVLDMPYSKPMPSVGRGVYELRSRGQDGIYRVFYYQKFESGILVFHCFKKKTDKTPVKEIEQGRKNLKEFI